MPVWFDTWCTQEIHWAVPIFFFLKKVQFFRLAQKHIRITRLTTHSRGTDCQRIPFSIVPRFLPRLIHRNLRPVVGNNLTCRRHGRLTTSHVQVKFAALPDRSRYFSATLRATRASHVRPTSALSRIVIYVLFIHTSYKGSRISYVLRTCALDDYFVPEFSPPTRVIWADFRLACKSDRTAASGATTHLNVSGWQRWIEPFAFPPMCTFLFSILSVFRIFFSMTSPGAGGGWLPPVAVLNKSVFNVGVWNADNSYCLTFVHRFESSSERRVERHMRRGVCVKSHGSDHGAPCRNFEVGTHRA